MSLKIVKSYQLSRRSCRLLWTRGRRLASPACPNLARLLSHLFRLLLRPLLLSLILHLLHPLILVFRESLWTWQVLPLWRCTQGTHRTSEASVERRLSFHLLPGISNLQNTGWTIRQAVGLLPELFCCIPLELISSCLRLHLRNLRTFSLAWRILSWCTRLKTALSWTDLPRARHELLVSIHLSSWACAMSALGGTCWYSHR